MAREVGVPDEAVYEIRSGVGGVGEWGKNTGELGGSQISSEFLRELGRAAGKTGPSERWEEECGPVDISCLRSQKTRALPVESEAFPSKAQKATRTLVLSRGSHSR